MVQARVERHRKAIKAAAKRCKSQKAMAMMLKMHLAVLRYRAKALGIILPQGRSDRPKQNPRTPRVLNMVELRKTGLTYQEIGDQYGITRERVRQLLKPVAPKLCGNGITLGIVPSRAKVRRFNCAHCGKACERPASVSTRHCSQKCAVAAKTDNATPRKIKQMRANGMTWEAAGRKFWPDVKQPGTYACKSVTRWEQRTQ